MAWFRDRQQCVAFRQARMAAMFVAGLTCLLFAVPSAMAQFGGGGGGGGGGDTIGGGATSGVAVDADGVLKRVTVQDPTGDLARQRVQEALTRLDRDVAQRSKLRKVSLTRLERDHQQRLAEGRPIDDAMQHLAGLTRLQYVFCYPESGDVVIAGPAEAWAEAPSGRMLGIESGRPVLELQDLVVALRAFPPGVKKEAVHLLLDRSDRGRPVADAPIPARASAAASATRPRIRARSNSSSINCANSSACKSSRSAAFRPRRISPKCMVEADYRMKLIGIGLEQPPVRLKSYVDRANPSQVARNALQRWYFVPNYQCVRVSDDALAMELVGDGVKLVGENEVVGKDGSRPKAAGGGNRASDAFVNAFTKVYPKLAERAPVYAQLRNCIDLAVAAAFIQHQDYYGLAKWKPEVFLTTKTPIPVETLNPPQQVESAVNASGKASTLRDADRRRRADAPDRGDQPDQPAG